MTTSRQLSQRRQVASVEIELSPVHLEVPNSSDMDSDRARPEMKTFGSKKSYWSPQMVRALLDFLDEHKGIDTIFVKDRPAALAAANLAITRDVPAQLRNDLSDRQIDQKIDGLARHLLAQNKGKTEVMIRGSAALDLLKLPDGTYTDEELRPFREKQKEAQEQLTKQKHKAQRKLRSEGKAEDSRLEGIQDSIKDVHKLADVSLPKSADDLMTMLDSADTKGVAVTMKELFSRIQSASFQRLECSGLSGSRSSNLSPEMLSPELQNILGTLFGCGFHTVPLQLVQIRSMQSRQQLQLDTFVRAVIAAAMTSWVLEPVTLGIAESSINDAWIKKLRAENPTVVAYYADEVMKDLLNTQYKPRIPARAQLLANRLDQVLAPLLSPPLTGPSKTLFYTTSMFDDNATSLADSTSSISGDDTSAAWYSQWMRDLEAIFAKAMKLRMKMEMMGGLYDFAFPRPGQYYSIDAEGTCQSSRGGANEMQVMLSIFPRVKGKFATTRGGEKGDWQLISSAEFYAFNPE